MLSDEALDLRAVEPSERATLRLQHGVHGRAECAPRFTAGVVCGAVRHAQLEIGVVPLFGGRDAVGHTKCPVEISGRAANCPDQVAKRVRQDEDGTAIRGLLLRRVEEVTRVINAISRGQPRLPLCSQRRSGQYSEG